MSWVRGDGTLGHVQVRISGGGLVAILLLLLLLLVLVLLLLLLLLVASLLGLADVRRSGNWPLQSHGRLVESFNFLST